MGKSNKPTKWFKAVKKAFRSPSKERPPSPDHQETADAADEKLLTKHDLSPVPYQAPTPHPLPSYEIITCEEVEPENSHGQPLPTPEAIAPAMSANFTELKELENVIEEGETSNNVEAQAIEKNDAQLIEKDDAQVIDNGDTQVHQDDDDDSTLSEGEEAAARIQQRFSEPLALNGLIRIQALVRGHTVRRQAATTLQTTEGIVRVQAVFRGRRVRMSKDGRAVRSRISKRRRLSSRVGAQYGDVKRGPTFLDKEPEETRDEKEPNIHKRPTAYLLTQQLKRSAPNRSSLVIGCGPGQPHWGWAWLELWTIARPWEVRTLEEPKGSKSKKTSSKNSKDYIEIVPGSRKNNSECTTKEVDVNTLKVKYYEDYVSNPTTVMSRSSNPSSEQKEPIKSSGPMSEKKEPAKASSHIVSEKKEPIRSPRSLPEKKEHSSLRSSSSPLSEKKEPVSVRSSASPFSEKKEPSSARTSSSPLSEKKESVSVRSLSSPLSEKKEPVSVRAASSPLSEKKEPVSVRASSSPLSEKKEPVSVRASSSPLSEKKEPFLRSSSSPLSEKKEPFSRSSSSPLSEKKEPFLRSSSSHLSQKKDPARSSTSSLSEKTELNIRSPSSPGLSEKRDADLVEPDWQNASPVAAPASPSASSTAYSHREISKPPPIEVPTHPHAEEERPIQVDPRTLEDPKSPVREKLVPLTPVVSETSLHVPPSPQASETSLPVPETPPGLDSAGDDSSMTMEHLVLPDSVLSVNGGVTHAAFKNEDTPSSGFSASNGDQQHREDSPSVKGSTSASASDNVVNGHTSNGHHENGDRSKLRKGEKTVNGENGESPTIPSKRPTSRYMEPTESAMAKFRSSSNPKTRAPDTPESPARTPKRYSIGGTPLMTSKGTDSPKTAFGTRKSNSFQNRGTPSPKAVAPKEKLTRSVEKGAESPARRNSIGDADGKRWRT